MLLKYISQKLYNRFYIRLLRNKRIFSNMYHIGYSVTKNVRSIVFYFPNPAFMNFGDHLFFEPVCRLLKANNFKVSVIPIKAMNYYFESAGYNIGNSNDLNKYDLIISRPDFVREMKGRKNTIIIDIADAGIQAPLINDICNKFTHYFNLAKTTSAKPAYILTNEDCLKKFNLAPDTDYVIYNNYLKSGSFRVGKERFTRLYTFLINFKRSHPELKVIHTGSTNDKLNDGKRYPFIDVDLRGDTSVMDLFNLAALPNIKYYIGFDAFVMHLFFLQNKKAYVLSRGRWTKKERFFLENYIDPPYAVDNLNEIKEYIR